MAGNNLQIMQINGKGCSVLTPKELLDYMPNWDYRKTACQNWGITEEQWFQERSQYDEAFDRAKKKYDRKRKDVGEIRGPGSREKRSVKLSLEDSAILLRNRLNRCQMSSKPLEIFCEQLWQIDDMALRARMAHALWWNYDADVPTADSMLFDGMDANACFHFSKKNGVASIIHYPARILYAEHIRFGVSPIDARIQAVAGARMSDESRKGNVEQYMEREMAGLFEEAGEDATTGDYPAVHGENDIGEIMDDYERERIGEELSDMKSRRDRGY